MRYRNEAKFIVALASSKNQLAAKVGIIWNSVRKPHIYCPETPLPYLATKLGLQAPAVLITVDIVRT